ncbi:hypothetical protein AC578_3512 [Pseudocercospora eumusae]|uniref:Zinc finger PHD-type domain-containing protein n=1 Tax=Pseudocercospora eumusae TaxID=321146 RepID=A0A139H9J8_9PEZI|nr:hypothetical protein AC578_3512 [Pseudocercospora eumusae]
MARTKRPFRDLDRDRDLSARRASKVQTLQTQLLASDPQSHVSVSPLAPRTPVARTADDTRQALFAVGYRSPGEISSDEAPLTLCTCNITVEAHQEVDLETMIRCGNRKCKKMWFHLHCVGLPDHPPIRLGWMCPECHQKYGVVSGTKGLWDFRAKEGDEGGKKVIREYFREEERKEKERRERERERLRERFWREEVGESDVDVDVEGEGEGEGEEVG